MGIHIQPDRTERNSVAGQWLHRVGVIGRPDVGLRWGVVGKQPKPPNARVLASPLFDPVLAPDGARLVRFADLHDCQCQWGFDGADGQQVFCGLSVDPKAKGSALFKRYCSHHVKAATGRTVVR